MTDLIAYTTDEAMTFAVTGSAPNGFFAHFFTQGNDMRMLFDPTRFGKLKLKLTNGGAGGAGTVVVQQVRR